ncbi:MAG TPA: ABC transporter ATP-binding protein [Ignavibacteriales bacterium]|nr:ABC transporter ATP-binding protein [Ignavibacteriales bacterium]HOL80680.1 ABC transporter ATP-binding protein [Ignavibacteriales bacterium]HOM64368.1 ABC transporter ATP-binding protein [Ignavibacteriales bacterium]HPD67156.1 ABC transporter ATP-binding protein [Ignavibacteriales bacterium]HPP32987.1 ABC transporter ATP-binding protein [Ignavibacteriales bacterium]
MILLDNISLKYKDSSNFAISNITLNIQEGNFIGIIGPNGSGKTTLIKVIANLLHPNKGIRKLYGKNYDKYSISEFYKKVSYVPQTISVTYGFSVYEIVMMGRTPNLNYFGIPKKEDYEIVEDKLNLLDIWHLRKKSITNLSGGELQRVLIAKALAQDSDILLLDEPNSFLDYKHQISIFKILYDIYLQGKTIILISHDLNLLSNFTNKLIVMKEGQIQVFDDRDNVLNNELLSSIFDVNFDIYQINNKKIISFSV